MLMYRKMPAKRGQPDIEMSTFSAEPTENFQNLRIVNYVEQSTSKTLRNSSHDDKSIKTEIDQ